MAGLFSYQLGSVEPFPSDLFAKDATWWLGTTVTGEDEIVPRTRLASSAYAIHAGTADTAQFCFDVSNDAIGSAQIENGSISLADLGQNGAAVDQIIRWSGSAWIVDDDATGSGGSGGWYDAGTTVRLETTSDRVGIGETAPLCELHVQDVDLSMTSADLHADVCVIEDQDAILGLCSNSAGSAGSALTLGEVVSGSLTGKWGFVRGTSNANNILEITYGPNPHPWDNQTKVLFETSGRIGVGCNPSVARFEVSENGRRGIEVTADNLLVDDTAFGLLAHATNYLNAAVGVCGAATDVGVPGVGSDESHSRGVYGRSGAGTLCYGVYGEGSASQIYGVYGTNPTRDNCGYLGGPGGGVVGVSDATGGTGVVGVGGPDGWAAEFTGNVRIRSAATSLVILELGEGLDYAESFNVSRADNRIDAGTVMIIDPDNPGKLAVCADAYDRKVAGIIAGANGLGSGVRLGAGSFDYDVALAGRVYRKVDALYGAVSPGDLLTTSPTPGHAMVVTDHARASGAVIGKAMEALSEGEQGMILVLVTLQ